MSRSTWMPVDQANGYDAQSLRLKDAALLAHTSATDGTRARSGVIPGPKVAAWAPYTSGVDPLQTFAESTPSEYVQVEAGQAVISDPGLAGDGAWTHSVGVRTRVGPFAAPPGSGGRIDLVVLDETSSTSPVSRLRVVAGTAGASPVPPDTDPSITGHSVILAEVRRNAGDGGIASGAITTRSQFTASSGGVIVCTSTTRPAAPAPGQEIFESDTGKLLIWSGSAWQLLYSPSAPAWTALALLNGWANFGSGWAPAQICKLPSGQVVIQGLITGGTTAVGTALFAVPAGLRPAGHLVQLASDNGAGLTPLRYNTSTGSVETYGAAAGSFIHLNLTWPAEA